jgi:hypothetical protein
MCVEEESNIGKTGMPERIAYIKLSPIPSWEDNYQWFSKKKPRWKRIRKSK